MVHDKIDWKSCQTIYFSTPTKIIKKSMIGLSVNPDSLINTIYYPYIKQSKLNHNQNLLSVTIVKKHNLPDEQLIETVQEELKHHFDIENCEYIKLYHISKALPDLKNIQYEMMPSETQLLPSIYIAGDEQLNGSLNAAMIAGERAALGVIESIQST